MTERLTVDVGPAGPVNDTTRPTWATVHRHRIEAATAAREASERDWLDMRLTRLRLIVLGKPMEIEPAPPPPATPTEALAHAVAVAVGGDPHPPDRLCRLCVRADELGMWQPLLGLTLAELA